MWACVGVGGCLHMAKVLCQCLSIKGFEMKEHPGSLRWSEVIMQSLREGGSRVRTGGGRRDSNARTGGMVQRHGPESVSRS